MNQIKNLLTVSVLLFTVSTVTAEETPKNINRQDVSTKGTEFNFEDLLVQGKYHFTDESVTTVEQDKVLDALLGVRKDFKDRIERSSEVF